MLESLVSGQIFSHILQKPADVLRGLKTPEILRIKYSYFEYNLDELWTTKKGFMKVIPENIIDNIRLVFEKSIPKSATLDQVANQFLLPLLDQHNKVYADHSRRVADIAYRLALDFSQKNPEKAFSETQLKDLYYSALLHDIGKAVIPNYILNNTNGRLEKEVQITRNHSFFTGLILSLIPQTKHLCTISSAHHERADGKGHLKVHPSDISPLTQLITLADYYDSITQNRVYHTGESGATAYDSILNESGLFMPTILSYTNSAEKKFESLSS